MSDVEVGLVPKVKRIGNYKRIQPDSPWDEGSMELLTRWWELGRTAKEITDKLVELGYSITRNAVIGKANRMNIKQPPRDFSPKDKKNKPRKRIIVPATDPRAKIWGRKKTVLPTFIETKKLDPNNPGIPITELTDGKCKAIVRDGTFNSLATYCGEPVDRRSFCAGHAEIYYQPPMLRRR